MKFRLPMFWGNANDDVVARSIRDAEPDISEDRLARLESLAWMLVLRYVNDVGCTVEFDLTTDTAALVPVDKLKRERDDAEAKRIRDEAARIARQQEGG